VLGLHTKSAQAVSRLAGGLRCMAQGDAIFYRAVATCDSAGEITKTLHELPNAIALAVSAGSTNSGFYILGTSLGMAFTVAFYLEKSCRKQLLVGTSPITEPKAGIWSHARSQVFSNELFAPGCEWPAVQASLLGTVMNNSGAQQVVGSPGQEEKTLRIELAEAHRELDRRGMTELIWNHCSAKLGDGLLITPGDRLWDSMEPGHLLITSVNVTANLLHQAVYDAVPSATAVVHTHSEAIEAVSCLKDGLSLTVDSEFMGRVAYHDWEGLSDDKDECPRLVAALNKVPGAIALMMRNHGAITFGSTVEEALRRHLALDAACRETLSSVRRSLL